MDVKILISLLLICLSATVSLSQISNDNCANAETLTLDVNNQASATFNTNDATASGVSPSCETNPRDGWYHFTMPFEGNLLITGSSSTEYAVYDACGGTELSCQTSGNHTFGLTNGNDYYIQAYRINGTGGNMTFTITATALITNDDCSSSQSLTLDGNNQASVNLNTNGATISGVSPSCETNPRDGWYHFTMPFEGNLLITGTSSSEYAVYDACGGTELSCQTGGNHTFGLTNGSVYYVQAYRTNGQDGSISFTITATALITNDDCSSSQSLTLDGNNQASVNLDTNGATISGVSPSCETNPRDGWYHFTMPFDGNLLITGTSSSEYAVYDACGGTELSCQTGGNHTFGLTNGSVYYVQAYRTNGQDGSISFTINATALITNDDCSSSQSLTLDGNNQASVNLNTNGATISGVSPSCETNPRDGWYHFTMPFDGNLLITGTSSSEYAVYDACGGTELSCQTGGNHTFGLTNGSVYYVQAYRTNGQDGNISFTITATMAIGHDECATATTVAFDANFSSMNSFDTNGATPSSPAPSCESSPRDGWYTMVAPINGTYQIGGSANTEFAVYEADAGGCYGTQLNCFTEGNIFDVVHGETYLIRAWRRNGTDGPMNVNLTPGIIPVAPGTSGSCDAMTSVTIDATNNDKWVTILDGSGNVAAAINANGQNLGEVTANLKLDANDVRLFGPDEVPYLRRELEVSPAVAPTSPVDVRIYILGDEYDDLALEDMTLNSIHDLRFYKEEGVSCTDGYGGTGIAIGSSNGNYDANDYYLQLSVSSFSTFFPASSGVTLPVELRDFVGQARDDTNVLTWWVDAEINTDRYEIECSIDGRRWEYLGAVKTFGHQLTNKEYRFIDGDPPARAFYRLKMIDRDHSFEYSPVIYVENDHAKPALVVYPNPTSQNISVINLTDGEIAQSTLLDVNGRLLFEVDLTAQSTVDLKDLPSGLYYLRVLTRSGTQMLKMMKR